VFHSSGEIAGGVRAAAVPQSPVLAPRGCLPRRLQPLLRYEETRTPIGLFASVFAFSAGLEKHQRFTLDHIAFAVG
jgi:hypothetical protein